MDIFETAIVHYITIDRSTLVIPQYDLDSGWASLDFLGINNRKQIIHIIEVTSSAKTGRLMGKIEEAFQPEKHVDRLKRQLHDEYKGEYDNWEIRAAIFVRDKNVKRFKEGLSAAVRPQVDVFAIEERVSPWDYYERIVGKDRSWDQPKPDDSFVDMVK